MLRKAWSKRWFRWLSVFLVVFILLFSFRNPILRGIGHYLLAADELTKTDAVFVLGGNSYERGLEGAAVYAQFPGTPIIATGANIPMQLLAFDTTLTEAELSRMLLMKKGVPDSLAIAFKTGTSTREEAESILPYCREHGYTTITVISSAFHLRRVKSVFKSVFEDSGIEVRLHGAKSKDFDPNEWWKHEEGLITVNNELMKMIYYFFKY